MKLHRFTLTLLALLSILLPACESITSTPPPIDIPLSTPAVDLTPIDLEAGYGYKDTWFELYFTNPESPLATQGTGGADGPLVKALDNAKLSIDVAAYSLSLNSVRFALIRAHDRGVTVRMVMESDNMDRSDPQALIQAGIPIIGDEQPGLMHDKFIVIDKSEVWVGSMNFTDSGTYEDNNNMMRILSTKLAENYSVEFNEMFEENLFGPDVRAQTPNPTITLDGTRIDTAFSPDDGVIGKIASVLSGAERSIYFMAFSFTSNDLGEIVRNKFGDGLIVQGVMDAGQVKSNQGTEYDPFLQTGLDVRTDGINGLMHHKVFIVDGKIVILGSYNFSQSAEVRNDENILIIYNEAIAQKYIEEFQRVWAQAPEN